MARLSLHTWTTLNPMSLDGSRGGRRQDAVTTLSYPIHPQVYKMLTIWGQDITLRHCGLLHSAYSK
jgi:hypothetical protein